jgi:uncharacterized protein (TIGR01244 family)
MISTSRKRANARIPPLFLCVVLGAVGATACGSEPDPEPAAEIPAATPEPVQTEPVPAEEGPEGVVNYTRVDATVACAGATPPEAMAELKTRGFVSVINFRTDGERGATVDPGRAAAENAGLKYYHLPFRQPSAEAVGAFLDTVGDPSNQPVYIHCGSANRVGAMWLIKRVQLDGWSVDEATAEAELIGLRSEALKEFALEYVRDGV